MAHSFLSLSDPVVAGLSATSAGWAASPLELLGLFSCKHYDPLFEWCMLWIADLFFRDSIVRKEIGGKLVGSV
jgi:hypothetical protein